MLLVLMCKVEEYYTIVPLSKYHVKNYERIDNVTVFAQIFCAGIYIFRLSC